MNIFVEDLINFNEFFANYPMNLNNDIKVKEEEDKYLAEVIIPGFKKNEIEISLDNFNLEIEASKDGKLIKEFLLKINEKVDIDNIVSKLEDGILSITLPKKDNLKKKILQIQ